MPRATLIGYFVLAAVVSIAAATLFLAFSGNSASASHELHARDVRGAHAGPGVSLWVHVYELPRFAPPFANASCDDTNLNLEDFSLFALSEPLTFALNTSQLDGLTTGAVSAVQSSIGTWGGGYLSYVNGGATDSPNQDLVNSVGAMSFTPPRALAATWTWVDDETNEVLEADIFFNTRHDWTVMNAVGDTCGGTAYDVENVGTHEVGHAVGLDHVNADDATMAPSAAAGETRKRTLTAGDVLGFEASLAGALPDGGGDGGGGPDCDKNPQAGPCRGA